MINRYGYATGMAIAFLVTGIAFYLGILFEDQRTCSQIETDRGWTCFRVLHEAIEYKMDSSHEL